jgi:hypothetical protein
MRYKLICSHVNALDSFVRGINSALEEGWRLHRSFRIDSGYIYQALVKQTDYPGHRCSGPGCDEITNLYRDGSTGKWYCHDCFARD